MKPIFCWKRLCFIVPCVSSYRWVHFPRSVLFSRQAAATVLALFHIWHLLRMWELPSLLYSDCLYDNYSSRSQLPRLEGYAVYLTLGWGVGGVWRRGPRGRVEGERTCCSPDCKWKESRMGAAAALFRTDALWDCSGKECSLWISSCDNAGIISVVVTAINNFSKCHHHLFLLTVNTLHLQSQPAYVPIKNLHLGGPCPKLYTFQEKRKKTQVIDYNHLAGEVTCATPTSCPSLLSLHPKYHHVSFL